MAKAFLLVPVDGDRDFDRMDRIVRAASPADVEVRFTCRPPYWTAPIYDSARFRVQVVDTNPPLPRPGFRGLIARWLSGLGNASRAH